ncbi:MAG: RNA polymerase sigma factor [Myxococcales bacterium]|nr:RNA polymerase sigma factor [Myxococcales bacterium]MCB9522899.1 RNA polymerase sigma factor [Myxococcales bacterium]
MSTTSLSQREVAELFREHGPMVYRRALRLLGNPADAEEAAQDVFVRVMRSSHTYDGRGALVGWLYRMTTNHCLNRIRDRKRRRELFELHVGHQKAAQSGPTSAADLVMLRWLLAHAEPKLAEAAVYCYLDGLSYREAAELLGTSKRTVGNLLERFQAWAEAQARTAAERAAQSEP